MTNQSLKARLAKPLYDQVVDLLTLHQFQQIMFCGSMCERAQWIKSGISKSKRVLDLCNRIIAIYDMDALQLINEERGSVGKVIGE